MQVNFSWRTTLPEKAQERRTPTKMRRRTQGSALISARDDCTHETGHFGAGFRNPWFGIVTSRYVASFSSCS